MQITLTPTSESKIQEINRFQSVIESAKTTVRKSCMDSANAMREAGVYLIELKRDIPRGHWLGLFATALGEANLAHVLSFDYSTGRRYMQFARAYPEPFTTPEQAIGAYREIYKTAGLIEAGPSTAGAERVTPVDGWMSEILKAVSSINSIVDKHNIATAPTIIKETFVERARPIVKLFFQAGGEV
jgi:hypothetical protein